VLWRAVSLGSCDGARISLMCGTHENRKEDHDKDEQELELEDEIFEEVAEEEEKRLSRRCAS